MSERTEVSFDAALMMALRTDAQKELDELPTPAQLKECYPDTSRWDARLKAALHKRRPVLKRVLVATLTLIILTFGALAVSADFRKAVYTMIQKFLPIEMQLTYQVDGEPLEQLPNGYSDHCVPDGFERDYEQGYDNEISFLHAYVDINDKNIFYYVDCSVIQDYGQVETFDETVKAEMNGLTPGLDRSPPPRWMGGQGGQSLKVFGRTRSFWGLSSPKIEMGGKALKWLSRLDYPLAKTGETVNGGAESAVHLDR